MDIYVSQDTSFDASVHVEEYESLVWTERYSSYGDFELNVPQDYYVQGLKNYKYLLSSESSRIMMMETAVVERQDEGPSLVKVTGRSFEAIMLSKDNRMGSLEQGGEIAFEGALGEIARYIVAQFLTNASVGGASNIIPQLTTVAAPTGTSVKVLVPKGIIYNMVKDLCDSAGLGFMIRKQASGVLVFQVYEGIDKTQPDLFRMYSPENDTLTDISTTESIANMKNHARVLGNKTGVDVYAPGVSSTIAGIDRRTIVIEASDIGSKSDETDPAKITTVADDIVLLTQRGNIALADANNSFTKLIDGTVPAVSWNLTSYGLGDKVIVQEKNGSRQPMRITETITTVDSAGLQRNPTFEALT